MTTIFSTNRNLDHLDYDSNLFDYMKSIIPFNILTSNNAVNKFLLNNGNGLEKGDFLNIYFNDCIGKRELIYEMLISALAPKEWG